MRDQIIAERTLEYRDGETTRSVTVRVYRPEERGSGDAGHWACRIEWDGLGVAAREAIGTDSSAALFNALDMVGVEDAMSCAIPATARRRGRGATHGRSNEGQSLYPFRNLCQET